jgi:MFS superfamily sulfate permease-like transporter
LIFLLRWWRPAWPGMLTAVVLASVIVWAPEKAGGNTRKKARRRTPELCAQKYGP